MDFIYDRKLINKMNVNEINEMNYVTAGKCIGKEDNIKIASFSNGKRR